MVNFARCKVLKRKTSCVERIRFHGTVNSNMIINSGLITTLFSILRVSIVCSNSDLKRRSRTRLVCNRRCKHDNIRCSSSEEEDFVKNRGVMNHETVETISKRRKPFTVDYTGFGWVLIKKGVFENLEYPGLLLKCKSLRVVMFKTCVVRTCKFLSLMPRRWAWRSGVILGFVLVMKKLGLFDILVT